MGMGRQVGEAEVDMAPFIGKSDGKITVHLTKCEFPNTYIQCEFKVTETTDTRGEDASDEEAKDTPTS
jgi:hypothetical protein